eukprot:6117484-Heterocapsa_arctica.AAC.1
MPSSGTTSIRFVVKARRELPATCEHRVLGDAAEAGAALEVQMQFLQPVQALQPCSQLGRAAEAGAATEVRPICCKLC